MGIKITWLGHACFKLEAEGFSVVIDPYTGIPGLAELQTSANMVLCSHSHADHNYVQAVEIIPASGPCPFKVEKIDSFHDDRQGTKSGGNIIHVLEYDGLRVAHFGDLGHMPDAAMQQKLGRCNALIVPVGGHYTIGPHVAKSIKDAMPPAVFIPMHYRGEGFGPDVIAPVDDFLALVDDARRYSGNSIELTAATPPQTAVLALL